MSTPNPTHIIAEGMREIATEGRKGTPGTRDDGQLWGAFPNTMTLTDLAAHVVSKLTDAGYSIVQVPKPGDDQVWEIEAFTVFTDSGDEGVRVGIDEYDNHSGADRGVLGVDTAYARRLALALLAAADAGEERDDRS